MIIYPGSHKGEFLQHGYPDWDKEGGVNKAYFGIKALPTNLKYGTHHLKMKAGDCVFFHPLLIHGSGENKTEGYRKAMCCHFASSQYFFVFSSSFSHINLLLAANILKSKEPFMRIWLMISWVMPKRSSLENPAKS